MVRRFTYILLLSLLVVSSLAGSSFHHGSAAASPEPQFSAAASATLIAQGGKIGKVFLPALPTHCRQFTADYTHTVEQVAIEHLPNNPISILAVPDAPSDQNVRVRLQLYQRLANNNYVFLKSSSFTTGTVSGFFSFVEVVGRFDDLPAGPDYMVAYYVEWYSPSGTVDGWALALQPDYYIELNDSSASALYDQPTCRSLFPPTVNLSTTTGTVNSPLKYLLDHYPIAVTVTAKWDGAVIDSVVTNNVGKAAHGFLIPAAPMGPHKLTFTYGHWVSSATFTIKPRIKIIPSEVYWGQTVNVSLRGYAKYETVRIRWKKGTSWVELARVTTSSTGSANVNVKVPTWAPIGANSVRGDGSYGHAQTNAVKVSAGMLTSSEAKTPTPTPAATKTPTPAPTAIPVTATPTPSPLASPTVEATTPEATATPTEIETATPAPAPDDTATPMPVTETPTPQPTAEATAEPSSGAPAPDEAAR
jgi:hypothetical protein